MKRRVVVTGMGAITPVGKDVNEFWDNIKAGKCGISKINDIPNFPDVMAGDVKDFEPELYMDYKQARKTDRYIQFALAASKEAVNQSKLEIENLNPNRFGVIIGSGIGGISTIEKEYVKMLEKNTTKVSPFLVPNMIGNMAAGNVAIEYGAKGPCLDIVTACASGTNSIGEAFEIIKGDRADVMICGGSEAALRPISVAGFTSLTALSKSKDPLDASLPFNKHRSGFVLGEGAGVLILEELEHALKRGATILGEISGYGVTCDAYHITKPTTEGAKMAMQLAIEEADIDKEEVSYINAHGTGTYLNDKTETAAIKELFGDFAYKIPVSSTKSMTGHLLGAAGAIEAVVCVKTLEDGFVPPTIGLNDIDEECDLDYVANIGRKQESKYALSNSLGFGGHNATLLFKKWEE